MTDETVTPASPIVHALAKLNIRQRRAAERYARALRARQIRAAVRGLHTTLLAGWSDLAASLEIEHAVSGHRAAPDPSRATLRAEIERRLLHDLGSLDDMPKAERIRQHLRD